MKILYCNFVCILILFSMCASVSAQVSVNEIKKPVKSILKSIEKGSEYKFFYSDDLKGLDRKVTVREENAPIQKVLDILFEGTDIAYVENNKYITLTFKEVGKAQQPKKTGKEIEMKGVVLDEKGEAVIGASVLVKGTSLGTITNIDGNFSLKIPENSDVQISYIGYLSKDVKASAGTFYKVVLQEDSKQLEEVVVVGYGQQKRKEITGSITNVKMSDIPQAGAASVSEFLSGKAAGLSTTINSAQPGGAVNMQIRGSASNRAPLIVIDGFPVTGFSNATAGDYSSGSTDATLASINPNDIESIDILKDASATSVYGTRAAGGVILITTKRGKAGKVSVDFTANTGFIKAYGLPDVLSGSDFMTEVNRANLEEFMYTNKIGLYGPNKMSDFNYTPTFSDASIRENPYSTNWLDEVLRVGMTQNYGVSVNGGSEKTKYMASVNYYVNKGVVKDNDYRRFSGQLNLDQDFNSKLKAGMSLNFSRIDMDNVAMDNGGYGLTSGLLQSAYMFSPNLPVRDENGDYSKKVLGTNQPNPVAQLELTNQTRTTRFLANVFLQYEPIKNLKLKGVAGTDFSQSEGYYYAPLSTQVGGANNGKADRRHNEKTDYQLQFSANYSTMLNDRHYLAVSAGTEYMKMGTQYLLAGNTDFVSDSFSWNNLGAGAGSKPTVGSGSTFAETLSYYARVNYTFDERFFLTANFRIDGSSMFGKNHQWGYFPGISVGWDFAREKFMKSLQGTVDQLKLRAGFGQTGNDNLSGTDDNGNAFTAYPYNVYRQSGNVIFGDTYNTAIGLYALGNPNLKWETQTDFNIGLDFSLWNGRVSGSLDYFNRVISDILGVRRLSSASEVTSMVVNLDAKKQTYGFEASVNTETIKRKNFQWNTGMTLTFYRDRWLKRDRNWVPKIYETEKAYMGEEWRLVSMGLIQPGNGVSYTSNPVPGTILFADVDGYMTKDGNIMYNEDGYPLRTGKPDGKIDEADLQKVAVNVPYTIGFNNTFRYKNFDLNIGMYGKFNQWKQNGLAATLTDAGILIEGSNQMVEVKERWNSDHQYGKYPSSLQRKYGVGKEFASDFYMEKAWFIRVRNIDLGYTFSLPAYKINSVRVYVSLLNPFLITPYSGIDPETDNNGFSYPNSRTYTIGLHINL